MVESATAAGRLRLLVLSSTYPRWRGDPEPAFVHELARRLVGKFEVMVICPHASGAADEEVLDDVRVKRYRYAPSRWETLVNDGGMLTNLRRKPWKWALVPVFMLAQWWALRVAMRRFRPDVVHAHWLLPQGLIVACRGSGVPALVTSHGADLFGLGGGLFAWLRRHVMARVTAISVVSDAMRQRILAEVPGMHAHVLPMGVDCERRFVPGTVDRAEDALLFVGRLVEKKGLRHLVEAMPAILAVRPRARLVVIGFGPELDRLRQRAVELGLEGKISFPGGVPQDQLPQHYQRASLFVAPFVEAGGGDQEGLGLVVAEAMACGCPVLVGDVPGVRDLVDDHTGMRVIAEDHAALAAAVVTLLQDSARRNRLATAGRAHVVKRYAWPAVAHEYAGLLESLAKGGA